MSNRRNTVIASAIALAVVGVIFVAPSGSTDEPNGADISSGSHRLNIVAYAVPKVGFDHIIPAFRDTEQGRDVGFAQSYGASGDQSRKAVRRVPADIVNFSVEPDITRLVNAGLVDEDWKDNVPEDESGKSVPFGSVVSFVTREGNPKGLNTWDDLLDSDVEVISPNPASSGSAKWNLLAPYSAWFFRDIAEQEARGEVSYVHAHEVAEEKLTQLVSSTFKVRPKSGREATSTFEQGQGNVLLSYENEAILLDRTSGNIDYLNPPETFTIENPVAVVNTSESLQQAEDFRDYLFTDDAERIWASQGFRTGSDLFNQQGQTPIIDSLPADEQAAFKPYEVTFSIDQLADAFAKLAAEDPALDELHGLSKDGKPRKGWGIVDAFLFKRAQPGSGDTDGVITQIYQEV
ncbi:extracellular solute-binding protein [Corynebacterium pacaense]|uniref:extracellular solute-binding protein n=1 Tax=Corynebacterium pacaense TaxID=1816684 RepID=UPI0009BBDDEC|nr:extracellular solute-binding protein [Corynebacterium pacaense]